MVMYYKSILDKLSDLIIAECLYVNNPCISQNPLVPIYLVWLEYVFHH